MDKEIRSLCVADQVLVKGRVAGENGGLTAVVDTIAKGRQFLATMIDFERGHCDACFSVDDSLFDLFRFELYTLRRIALAPHANVDVKGFG